MVFPPRLTYHAANRLERPASAPNVLPGRPIDFFIVHHIQALEPEASSMASFTLTRVFAYTLMQGIERSLGETILHSLDLDKFSLFSPGERDRALSRLQEDLNDDQWTIPDVTAADLLRYLDVGDLLAILARHAAAAKNVQQKHIEQAATIINNSGLLTIRTRVMHPIRPLEPDDCTNIRNAAHELLDKCPSLDWPPLREAVRAVANADLSPHFVIPAFWAEKSPIAHNLPAAEFDDTGFIGRADERRKIAQLLKSAHTVITVVGEGGAGKTALALRTCYDILDDPNPQFDRLIWVSLKSRRLTPAGIKDIANAVDSVEGLIATVATELGTLTASEGRDPWQPIVDSMGSIRTLLVVDNLETIGELIRDFLIQVPPHSKVLMTARIGLGEIEVRHQLADFPLRDAVRLFRGVASVSGYEQVLHLPDREVERYCQRLGSNPLLVKWFVHAVGGGADPSRLHPKAGGAAEALGFCFENVLERLHADAKLVLAVLMAARRPLTRTQIQELTALGTAECERAYLDLVRSSMVDGAIDSSGSRTSFVSNLVGDYLSRHHPPSDDLLHRVRSTLSAWRAERDRAIVGRETYRYDRFAFQVATPDQSITARYLRQALEASRRRDHDEAWRAWERADELLPTWFEVPRVKALLLAQRDGPVFEVEDAFETSIECHDLDTNRYHYAVYLMRQGDFDRSLEQVEAALKHPDALVPTLTGLRGLVLLRMGKYDDAIEDLEQAYGDTTTRSPIQVKRSQATQLIDALRRRAEQSLRLGRREDAMADLGRGTETCLAAIDEHGVDRFIVEVAVQILSEAVRTGIDVRSTPPFAELVRREREDPDFVAAAVSNPAALRHLGYSPELQYALPALTACLPPDRVAMSRERSIGHIARLQKDAFFGFVATNTGQDVHFSRDSLVDPFAWKDLSVDDLVEFSVVQQPKGPHAVGMRRATTAKA